MLLITLISPPHDRLEATKWRKDNNIKRCLYKKIPLSFKWIVDFIIYHNSQGTVNELLVMLVMKKWGIPLCCTHCKSLQVRQSQRRLRDKSAHSLGTPLNPFLLRCSDLLSTIWFIKSVEQINYKTCNGEIWWPEILAYVSVWLLKVARLYCTANITSNFGVLLLTPYS